jgi:hypothetical protein
MEKTPHGNRLLRRDDVGISKVKPRVARFFLVQNTKAGKKYQMTTNYTECK